jgi:MFS family permease
MTQTNASAAAPQAEPWPDGRYAWWVVVVLALTQALAFVDRQVLALLVEPIKRDLQVSDTWISLLYGLSFALFYVMVGLPIARLADRSSRRNIIGIATAFWSVMTALCGLASNFTTLVLARMGVGAGEAGFSPSAQSIMADYFPPERLSAAQGVMAVGTSLGAGLALIGGGAVLAAAPAIAAAVLPGVEVQPWRVVMVLVGLPGLLVALLYLTVREPKRRGARSGEALPVSAIAAWLWEHRWAYLGLMGALSLMVFVGQSGSAWIPAFFERRFGWEGPQIGATYGPLVLLCGAAGALGGGLVSSWLRRRGRTRANLTTGLVCFTVAVLMAVSFPLAGTPELALGLIGIMSLMAAAPIGGGYATLQEITPPRMRAQVTALNGLLVNLIGAGLGPMSVGLATDFLFRNPARLPWSLAVVAAVFGPLTVACFALARSRYPAVVAATRARAAGG